MLVISSALWWKRDQFGPILLAHRPVSLLWYSWPQYTKQQTERKKKNPHGYF